MWVCRRVREEGTGGGVGGGGSNDPCIQGIWVGMSKQQQQQQQQQPSSRPCAWHHISCMKPTQCTAAPEPAISGPTFRPRPPWWWPRPPPPGAPGTSSRCSTLRGGSSGAPAAGRTRAGPTPAAGGGSEEGLNGCVGQRGGKHVQGLCSHVLHEGERLQALGVCTRWQWQRGRTASTS